MQILQRPRPKIVHSEPHGDVLAVSLLASVSSMDHFGGARTLGYQKKKKKLNTKEKENGEKKSLVIKKNTFETKRKDYKKMKRHQLRPYINKQTAQV